MSDQVELTNPVELSVGGMLATFCAEAFTCHVVSPLVF